MTNSTFTLNNFEGTIRFLLYLIQKGEVEIFDIPIHELTHQFLEKEAQLIEEGSEFIGVAAYLVWLKSKRLLPQDEQEDTLPEEEDPHFEIIHHLVEYSRFKQAAKELAKRHEKQMGLYFRGATALPEAKKPLGIDHISLDELSNVFQEMLKRAVPKHAPIEDEPWTVSDKIKYVAALIDQKTEVEFQTLFTADKSRIEWIVTFLAILELMKMGKLVVKRDSQNQELVIARE